MTCRVFRRVKEEEMVPLPDDLFADIVKGKVAAAEG